MKRTKRFQAFNESNDPQIDLFIEQINAAYGKTENSNDVIFAGQDKESYNFYVNNTTVDDASIATKVLEEFFGEDYVSFEILDLTVKTFSDLKATGIFIPVPEKPHNILIVRISKKHPTERY